MRQLRGRRSDVVIIEIGGTVGDIECLPFLEAIRQFALELGREQRLLRAPDAGALHRRRRRAQDQADAALGARAARDRHPADVLICRTERPLSEELKEKIALFCNVEPRRSSRRATSTPSTRCRSSSARRGSTRSLLDLLGLPHDPRDMSRLEGAGRADQAPRRTRCASPSSASTSSCRTPTRASTRRSSTAASPTTARSSCVYISAEELETERWPREIFDVDGILVPGGFGERGIEGKIRRDPLRPRAQDPLLRHLPRHAVPGDRVRAQRAAARERDTRPSSTRRPTTR